MYPVLLLGTKKNSSQYFNTRPPFDPRKPNTIIFLCLAFLTAFKIFLEFPDVVIAINMSFELAKDSMIFRIFYQNQNHLNKQLMLKYPS